MRTQNRRRFVTPAFRRALHKQNRVLTQTLKPRPPELRNYFCGSRIRTAKDFQFSWATKSRCIMATYEVLMSVASLKVNGRVRSVDVDPACPLLYVLRDNLELNNPRFGCGVGQCGACTVIVDNHAVRSCQLTVAKASGREIVTLEGLETAGKPHPVQAAFIAEQTFQCGYCLNGWVMSAKALLDKNPHPTDAEMRTAFENLVCRCGSHVRIFSAVRKAADAMKGRA